MRSRICRRLGAASRSPQPMVFCRCSRPPRARCCLPVSWLLFFDTGGNDGWCIQQGRCSRKRARPPSHVPDWNAIVPSDTPQGCAVPANACRRGKAPSRRGATRDSSVGLISDVAYRTADEALAQLEPRLADDAAVVDEANAPVTS